MASFPRPIPPLRALPPHHRELPHQEIPYQPIPMEKVRSGIHLPDHRPQIRSYLGKPLCTHRNRRAAILLQSLRETPVFMPAEPAFTDVPTAIEEIRAGRMIVVVDDEDRENEGDLTMAAEKVTPEAINFMAKFGRGLICLAMTPERLDYLRIGPMTRENTSPYGTAFYESVEAREGVTTGISAHDRARTIQVAIDPASRAADLVRPGHVFPLAARKGGVLVRAGQTEASVDLARMAGMVPAGVICEIMNEDGTMARVPDLI